MPSASVKSDSTGSSETQDPLGKLYLLVEKKTRNLEKRKNKLENYKTELVDGKELNEDQQRAVDAYDAVVASLELCKEFGSQIDAVLAENVKLGKLQQKKQQEEKSHHELERIKQVLKVQDALRRINQAEIRADFAAGTNGAVEIKADKLKHLDALYKLVTPPIGPEREKTINGFKGQLNVTAENLLSLVDGKNKPAAPGTTYRDMKTLVHQIANCSYPKVTRSAQISNASSPVPNSESQEAQAQAQAQVQAQVQAQPQPQKTKKSKANKGKNQIPNGTPANEGTASKQSSKNNSRVAPASVSNSSKSASLPPSVAVAPIVSSSSVPAQVSSPSKSVSQNTVTHSAPSGKSKRRETHSTEGPPPGIITTPTVQGAQPSNANLISVIPPQVRTGLGTTANSATLSHANAYFNASQSQSAAQTNSRVSLDINELVTTGSFNFLQESQVVGPDPSSSQAAVYVDPAVVSFCSMKPESLVQLHEQQHKQLKQLTTQSVPPVLPSSAASAVDTPSHQHQQQQQQQQQQHGHIPSETFINQAFVTSSGPVGYSQVVPSYSSTAGVTSVEAATTSLPPAPIPLPKEEKKSFVEQSSSWAAQEDTDGWGAPEPPPANSSVNGGDSWGNVEGNEPSTWGEPCDVKPQQSAMQEGDERRGGGGFRGMSRGRGGGSRGSSGTGGGYRGGRGNYSSYQGGNRDGSYQGGNREGSYQGGNREGSYQGGNREGSYQGANRDSSYQGGRDGSYQGGNRDGSYQGGNRDGSYQGGNRESGYQGGNRDNNYQGGGRGSSFGGGNGYAGRGGRGPSSNGGGYRGRGNFSRGGRGSEGNSRGGGLRRGGGGGFQGNQQMQRSQY